MAGSFSRIYIMYVFSPYGHQNLLHKSWRKELFKYMAGIIREKGQKPIIINGVSDHVHVLVGLKPSMRISDLVRDIKNNSSNFINEKRFVQNHFSWQEGYGVFSYSQYELDKMYRYIENQEEHHRKKTFREEYIKFLKDFDIEFKDKYLFDFFD